jgi:hypothetical protein
VPGAQSELKGGLSRKGSKPHDVDHEAIAKEIQARRERAEAYAKRLDRARKVTQEDLRTQVSI